VLAVKQSRRQQKYVAADVSALLEESFLYLPRKSMQNQFAEFRIPNIGLRLSVN
jgi:hypothetical protein